MEMVEYKNCCTFHNGSEYMKNTAYRNHVIIINNDNDSNKVAQLLMYKDDELKYVSKIIDEINYLHVTVQSKKTFIKLFNRFTK